MFPLPFPLNPGLIPPANLPAALPPVPSPALLARYATHHRLRKISAKPPRPDRHSNAKIRELSAKFPRKKREKERENDRPNLLLKEFPNIINILQYCHRESKKIGEPAPREVVAGNIRSLKRAKYGIIGSAVKLTHQIQGQAQAGEVIISAAILHNSPEILSVSRTIRTRLKGISAPVTLYAVEGMAKKRPEA